MEFIPLRKCALSWNPFFCYLSSHLIVNDFCYFCASIRGNFYRGLCPLNTPPLTPKNYFSNFCFLEFDSQSYNKHSQNFVIRNMQTKFACSLKFVSLKLITFLNSMSCPTQKSFHEKISRFLEKMLSNVFRVHLSYLPSAHLKNFF